ncbi:restriction endonuclease subunit S [Burkholderia cenocepacia]|uniref:restriction endonuclease subunit S n=1 Tax=Burkholderia cenocepacia TaxID=95486 RepID=UPI002AB7633F|nr:restriction endonuclease subunit S [Burkholderia cenocepacia]
MKLIEGFQLLAMAPDGVARLRELILSLAVQGRLITQNPDDESATSLLRQIRAQKDRLIGEGKIRRDKPLPEIADEEKPFELPAGWDWARMQQIADARLGKMLDKAKNSGKPYPYLRNTNVQWHRFDLEDIKVINLEAHELDEYRLRSGDLLICEGGEPGRCAIWREQLREMYFQKALHRVRLLGGILPEYVAMCLEIDAKSLRLQKYFTGATIKHFAGQELSRYCVPLPPLAEQSRIVAKVAELMHLCDKLETHGRLEAEQHARLTTTLFDALSESESSHALVENWARIATHFDLLLDRPEAVDALEQTILQLAVRGRLIKQEPGDEPAGELLKKIRSAKDRLIAMGEIKRGKPLPSIEIDEQRYTLPPGWEWVRLGTLCSVLTDGEHLTPERTNDQSQVRLVTAKNVRDGFIDYRVTDFVPRSVAEKCWARCRPQAQDVLMVSVGATTGRVSVLQDEHEMVLVRSVTLLRPVTAGLNPRYLELHLRSPDSQDEIWSSVKQNAQPCLYLAKSACLQVALPPLAEQARIVARVEELRRVCADLRARLIASQNCKAHFAEALVERSASTAPLIAPTDRLAAAA